MSVAKAWLTILGIGDDGLQSLTPNALAHFEKAEQIVAPERVLAALPEAALAAKKVIPWTTRIHETLRSLHENRGEPVTILATGDPYHFGIAATLSRSLSPNEMIVIPHPSGFSLAAARLGWALQDVDCISLHGRKVERLQVFIEPDHRILALTSNGDTIQAAAQILIDRGFGASQLHVLEHIGGHKERILSLTAEDAKDQTFADFNMLAINCVAGKQAKIYSRLAGLSDDAFVHDGQLTKREVRAATMAALSPYPGALLWDLGAGCGSIAVEWMRSTRNAKAVAFEKEPSRLAMIYHNAAALGVPDLEVVEGAMPETFHGATSPDAVFIGGGLTKNEVFETAWHALRPGGVLVANTVTLDAEATLLQRQKEHGGNLVRMDVSNLTKVGTMQALQPRMSVLQWQVRKP